MAEETKLPVKRKKNQPLIVEAFDIIVDATSKYLRTIFPPIFKMSQEKKKTISQ